MAKADSPTKLCGEDGCGRSLRARGLCVTHYNQQHQTAEQRHRKVSMACAWCGRDCEKTASERYDARFCSYSCRDTWRQRRKLPVPYVGTAIRLQLRPAAAPLFARRTFVGGRCARCGAPFLVKDYASSARYCSHRCAKRVSKQAYRARKKDAFVAPVSPAAIYERDRWRCQLCGKKVLRTRVVPHPRAPVLDHIIPLARGGTHEPANVQCAHFICNSIKSDRGYAEQLLLFG